MQQKLLISSPLVALVLFLSDETALADQIDVASRVEAVTLHLDAALVRRTGEFSVPAGDSTLVLRGVSPKLVQQSVRVKGTGDGEALIGAVTVRPSTGEGVESEATKRLAKLLDEKQMLSDRIEASETKKRAIQNFARASADAKEPRAVDLPASWAAVTLGLDEADDRIRDLRRQRRIIEGDIEKARQAVQLDPLSAPGYDVSVEITAHRPAKGKIALEYLVHNAKWAPVYDARLNFETPPKGRLTLVRRAEAAQRVGEVWENIRLVLKTTNAVGAIAAPRLSTLEASPGYPGQADMPSRKPPDDLVRLESEKDHSIRFQEAVASQSRGAFDASFEVPGLVSLPANGATKVYRLAQFETDANVLVKSTPVNDSGAYLHAKFSNTDSTPLFLGPVQLYRDGSFIGRTILDHVPSKEIAELGFGSDDSVSVRRIEQPTKSFMPKKEKAFAWEERQSLTEVRNGHAFPMRVMIEDRLPVSTDAALKVEQRPDSTPPSERNVDDRSGVVAWAYNLAPGETRQISFGYRATWPRWKGEFQSWDRR
ncbi:MAG: mucoidy inhibitor MuiA family protein [Alphaproteobacteria bacterium]|nr:mucoidy inhibitor MuiA family protein [Alphaproteobacteria bacterium]